MITRSSSSQPDAEILNRLWGEYPYAPRAVAILFHLMGIADHVTSNLESGDPEMLAQVLADSYPIQSAFEAEYGIESNLARAVAAQATVAAMARTKREAGDLVECIVASRLFFRLGYIDGLKSAFEAPRPEGRPPLEEKPPTITAPEDAEAADRIAEIIGRVLNPAYQAGLGYGAAEVLLNNQLPALREAIDREAMRLRSEQAGPREVETALREIVQERRFVLDPVVEDLAMVYAEGRAHQVREHRARAAVMGYVRHASPISPLSVASVIRVLGRERERAKASAPERVAAIEDELEEAILLSAVCGFSASMVSELLEQGSDVPRPPSEIIASEPCDTQLGALMRRTLIALGRVPGAAKIWSVPQDGIRWAPPGADQLKLNLSTSEDVDGLLNAIREKKMKTQALVEIIKYQEELEAQDPQGKDWPWLVALYAARMAGKNDFEEVHENLWQDYVRIEAELACTNATDPTIRLRHALLTHVARRYAKMLLKTWDPSGEARVRAELELLEIGNEKHVALAENWLRAYEAEASEFGASWGRLQESGVLLRDENLAEGLLLRARARLLENALNEWAFREARRAILCGLPDFSANVYLGEGAPTEIVDMIETAKRSALREVQRMERRNAHVGTRVRRWVPVAALETLVSEVQVVSELARREELCGDSA